jgi:hypothetical protein
MFNSAKDAGMMLLNVPFTLTGGGSTKSDYCPEMLQCQAIQANVYRGSKEGCREDAISLYCLVRCNRLFAD